MLCQRVNKKAPPGGPGGAGGGEWDSVAPRGDVAEVITKRSAAGVAAVVALEGAGAVAEAVTLDAKAVAIAVSAGGIPEVVGTAAIGVLSLCW